MRLIPLTKGMFAKVDDADYEWLSQWKWTTSRWGYAHRARPRRKNSPPGPHSIFMHRLIMGVDGIPLAVSGEVDHIDRDRLNNQRSNLRMSDHRANQANTAPRSASGIKGIRHDRVRNKWQAYALAPRENGRQRFIHLGLFDTAEEAMRARLAHEKGDD